MKLLYCARCTTPLMSAATVFVVAALISGVVQRAQ